MRDRQERRVLAIMLALVPLQLIFSLVMIGGASPAATRFFVFRTSAGLAWVAATIVGVAYVWASVRSLPQIRDRLLETSWLKVASIPFSLGAACLEELLFRRALMNTLHGHGVASFIQVITSAVAFGVAHSFWGAFSGNLRGVLLPVLWTTILGGLLAGVYLLGGRDTAPCIWGHAMINLVLEPWLLVSLMKSGHAPAQRDRVSA